MQVGADAVEQSMDGRVSGTNTTENPKVGPQRQLSQRKPRICASRSWPLLVLGVPSSVGVPPVTLQCACNSPQKGTGTASKRDALCCNWSQSAVGVGSLLLPWPECANAMPVCRRVPGAPGSRLVRCSIHSCTTYQNQHKPGVMDSRWIAKSVCSSQSARRFHAHRYPQTGHVLMILGKNERRAGAVISIFLEEEKEGLV